MTPRLAVVAWSVALALSAAAIALIFTSDHEEAPFQVAALAVASGLAWIGSGLYAWLRRPDNRTGPLMTAVGFSWFLGALSESDSSVVFTIGLALGGVVWIFVAWVLLAYPTGRLKTPFRRLLVGVTVVFALVMPIPALLVGDSETLIDCADCPANALLVERNVDVAEGLISAQQAVAIVIVVGVGVALVRRWRRATPPQRRTLAPVYLTSLGLLTVILVITAVDALGAAPDELDWFLLAGLLAIPVSFLLGLLRMRLAAGHVPRMLREAIPEAPTAEEAQEGLRRVLRDPTLELAYSLPERGIYVDVAGRPYALPPAGSDRAVTPLEYQGRRVAAIVHDPALANEPALLDSVVTVMRVAIERNRLQAELSARVQELEVLAAEQAALRRVAVVVASERRPQRVFDVVTEEVGRLLDADAANVIRFPDDPDEGVVIGQWSNGTAVTPLELGSRIRFDGPTAVARVRRTGEPARVDALDDLEGELAARLREHGIRCVVAAPINVSGRLWGAVAVSSNEAAAFAPDAESRIGKFSSLVALALANAETLEQLAASRARIVHAGDTERRRLERDLHDGAQQRLISLSIALRLARARVAEDPAGARQLLDAAAEELGNALEELRELARGIHPAVLTDRGLRAAIEALASRSPVPVELESVPSERLPEPVEVAAFYVVSESLANVAKYASAEVARIRVARQDGRLVVEVADDGVGGADPSKGSGLRGLTDRVEALEGELVVTSTPGSGTCVRAEIPFAP
jgi:signal transduction histidine kinase